MSNAQLLKFIKNFRNRDMTAFTVIYEEFEGLILFYAKRLGGEDYSQELTVFLIELLYSMRLSNFKADETNGAERYISVCIRNKYIAISKEKQKYENITSEAFENDLYCYSSAEELVLVEDMLKNLSYKQRLIIVYKYIYGYSDVEIGMLFNISRQAVNRLKNRALNILEEYYIGRNTNKL